MSRKTLFGGMVVALVGLLWVWAGTAAAQTVRAVMHAEVKFLDPHSTTADITQPRSALDPSERHESPLPLKYASISSRPVKRSGRMKSPSTTG